MIPRLTLCAWNGFRVAAWLRFEDVRDDPDRVHIDQPPALAAVERKVPGLRCGWAPKTVSFSVLDRLSVLPTPNAHWSLRSIRDRHRFAIPCCGGLSSLLSWHPRGVLGTYIVGRNRAVCAHCEVRFVDLGSGGAHVGAGAFVTNCSPTDKTSSQCPSNPDRAPRSASSPLTKVSTLVLRSLAESASHKPFSISSPHCACALPPPLIANPSSIQVDMRDI